MSELEKPSYYERMKRIWNRKKVTYTEYHEYPARNLLFWVGIGVIALAVVLTTLSLFVEEYVFLGTIILWLVCV